MQARLQAFSFVRRACDRNGCMSMLRAAVNNEQAAVTCSACGKAIDDLVVHLGRAGDFTRAYCEACYVERQLERDRGYAEAYG